MALPDRLEAAGIVLGSVVLLALPTSELSAALVGFSVQSWWLFALWAVPGLVVGLPLASGRLPVTYGQVWTFSLVCWILTPLGWALVGLSVPPANRPVALAVWVVAALVAALVAVGRPVAVVRGRLRRA